MPDTEPSAADATTFDVVFRGYDRAQVTTFITALVERAERDREALRALQGRGEATDSAAVGKLGKVVESIVRMAEREAAALVADAEAEAEATRERAKADSVAILAAARAEAADDIRRAHDEVAQTLRRVHAFLNGGRPQVGPPTATSSTGTTSMAGAHRKPRSGEAAEPDDGSGQDGAAAEAGGVPQARKPASNAVDSAR